MFHELTNKNGYACAEVRSNIELSSVHINSPLNGVTKTLTHILYSHRLEPWLE